MAVCLVAMGSGPRAGLQLLYFDGVQIFHSLSQPTMWPTRDLKSAFLFLFWFLNHIFAQEMKFSIADFFFPVHKAEICVWGKLVSGIFLTINKMGN